MVALAGVPITAYLHTLTIYQMYAVALSPTCRR